jgi:hypothetical protein
MLTLPAKLLPLIVSCALKSSRSIYECVRILLVGAIQPSGKPIVTTCLGIWSKSQVNQFQNDNHVLNCVRWLMLQTARILLRLLIMIFAPSGKLLIVIDHWIKPRNAEQIRVNGMCCDQVRSSQLHLV